MARAARAVTSMSERRNRVWLGIEVPLSVIRNERSVSIIETRPTGNTPLSSITSRFDELPGTAGARGHSGRGDGGGRAAGDPAIGGSPPPPPPQPAPAPPPQARAPQNPPRQPPAQ